MTSKKLEKTLKKHEARYRYWSILKEEQDFFPEKNDIVKIAVVKYLDDMHLLDQVKSSIETHPLEK